MAELGNPHITDLVKRAAEAAGSMNKLAKVLGVTENVPRDWAAGRRNCNPEDRARLAGLARLDAVQELILATLEKNDGTLRGEQLRALLGNALRHAGGVAALGWLALGSLIYWPTPAAATTAQALDTMLGKVKRRRPFPA
jgi:hypothetical protein